MSCHVAVVLLSQNECMQNFQDMHFHPKMTNFRKFPHCTLIYGGCFADCTADARGAKLITVPMCLTPIAGIGGNVICWIQRETSNIGSLNTLILISESMLGYTSHITSLKSTLILIFSCVLCFPTPGQKASAALLNLFNKSNFTIITKFKNMFLY